MKKITCTYIGLGLIGGSIAKSLRLASEIKQNGFDLLQYGWDPDVSSIDLAVSEGVLDGRIGWGFGSGDSLLSAECIDILKNCDFIFLCAPVSHNTENLAILRDALYDCNAGAAADNTIEKPIITDEGGTKSPIHRAAKDHTISKPIITDVGSVKSPIHRAAAKSGLTSQFIGGHPMAGSERFGYRNSSALILQNAYYILTPESEVSDDSVLSYRQLVEYMGAIPLVIPPDEHDRVTAAISHLPHVLASALVNLVREKDGENGLMKTMAAGGFKDITRIASSSPDMWQQICLNNSANIIGMLDDYIESLQSVRKEIRRACAPAIHSFFDNARVYRDSFIEASYGPIKKAFDMYINIADEPGVIAQISTTLAVHGINIKNLGIIHNRERAEGALRIQFYNDEDLAKAGKLLEGKGYSLVSV